MDYVSFADATPKTYAALGLMSGLEIHQQLLTRKKLFCRCPAGMYSPEWHAEILRHMRPTLSEMGEYDGTALMEFKTRKEIVYRIHKDTVCTYEFDDTPPFPMNEDALDIALRITLQLGCNPVSELHVARKQYLDGSIPTGFQRTTILGVEGSIPCCGRRIRIRQLGLEEDACREFSDRGHLRVYLSDRLGMPLVETVTYHDMRTPREVAEVAEALRRLVRATGSVRTGAGAARQDVNVSVTGGARVEIKGVSSIRAIPLLVHNEAFRQSALLDVREELLGRGIDPSTFAHHACDLTSLLPAPGFDAIRETLAEGGTLFGVRLDGFRGVLSHPMQPGIRLRQEFSDRVRVIACLHEQPNLLDSDDPGPSLSPAEWRAVRRAMETGDRDAVVLVWGPAQDVMTAVGEIRDRARELLVGVPNETRQSYPDGATGFERILPGPNRMYPDTDLPPLALEDGRIERARRLAPKPPWDRHEQYRALGLSECLAAPMSYSIRADLMDEAVAAGTLPSFAARVLWEHLQCLRRAGEDVDAIPSDFFRSLFARRREGALSRDAAGPLLAAAARGQALTVGEAVELLGLDPASPEEIDAALEAAVGRTKRRVFRRPEARLRYAMGGVMERLRGRCEGAEVLDCLRRRLAQECAIEGAAP